MLTLATSANAAFFDRLKPCLAGLQKISDARSFLVCVDGKRPDYLPELPHVTAKMLSAKDNYGAPDETQSAQHGAWLRAVPGEPDDVCLFMDGDVVCQRDFSAPERRQIAAIPPSTLWAVYNSGPRETLAVEAERLKPKTSREDRVANWRGYDSRPCFNIGLVVARRSTLAAIHAEYIKHWPKVCETFEHAARQQWLFCWTTSEIGVKIEFKSHVLHANGHYGIPEGVTIRKGIAYHRGTPVVFRHRL